MDIVIRKVCSICVIIQTAIIFTLFFHIPNLPTKEQLVSVSIVKWVKPQGISTGSTDAS